MALIAYRGSRIEEWYKAYLPALTQAAVKYPEEYGTAGYSLAEIGHHAVSIANKSRLTLQTRGVGAISIRQSHGWMGAARALGIPNTYKAWEAFFNGK